MPARVSIVIPVYNRVDLTTACLVSLVDSTPDELYEVVVIDNGSTDGTPALLATLSGDITVVTNAENRGFGEACNQGAARAQGEYLLFLNNDTVLFPGWLEPLVAALDEDARRGAVQPRLLYPDGRLNDAGGLVFADGDAWVYGKGSPWPAAPDFSCRRAVDYASGACLLVRRTAFEQVGGFDPRYAPAYYEDTDLSFSLRQSGWHLLYEPASTIVHVEGGTAGTDETSGLKAYQVRNKERFAEKWADELSLRPAVDPRLVEAWAHRPQPGFAPGNAAGADLTSEPLSILLIDPFTPAFDVASGSKRLFELLTSLRAQGHSMSFFTWREAFDRAKYAQVLGRQGITLYGLDPSEVVPDSAQSWAYRPDIRDVLANRRPDVVVVGPWATAEQALPWLRRAAPDAAVVVDSSDLHFLREQREAEVRGEPVSAEMLDRRRRELAVYAAADHVVCVTADEADVLARDLPRAKISVIGNVHREVEPGPGRAGRSGLLFVGNANHAPNVDAVRWWRDEIAPRLARRLPGVELTVVGNDPRGALRALAGPGVRVQGWVPDVAPYLRSAVLSVAPLRYGAGMKGKVGEALAAGLPVVVTPVAAEGMGLVDGVQAMVAEDADSFADAVVRLHEDALLWQRLSEQGRRHIERLAGEDAVRQQLRALLGRLRRPAALAASRQERRAAARAATRGRRRAVPDREIGTARLHG